jgi:hypothetical protein
VTVAKPQGVPHRPPERAVTVLQDDPATIALERRKIAEARAAVAEGRALSGEEAGTWLRDWAANEARPGRKGRRNRSRMIWSASGSI